MKISEVIRKLQEIKKEYGDLDEVRIAKDDRYFAFEEFTLSVDYTYTTLYIG